MIKPLKAFRETRDRIASIQKTTKDLRTAVSPLERQIQGVAERLDAQQEALAKLGRLVDGLRRSSSSRGDLRKFAEKASSLSQAAERRMEARLRRHEWVLKKTQERLVRVHLSIEDPADDGFLAVARPLVKSRRTFLGFDRLYVLWQAVHNTARLNLPAVEIGSFRGGSARLIAQASVNAAGAEREVHVVDTFTGHIDRQISERDDERHRGKFSATSFEDVKQYLSDFVRLTVHQGDATTVVSAWPDRQYSLLHLDVDLYEPTRDCLAYFWPRMAPGGVVVFDDYGASSCPGIRTAIDEFLAGRQDFQRWDTLTEQLVLIKR